MSKSTNKELVIELQALNKDNRLDQIINKAIAGHYHDFKAPEHVVCGKMEFGNDSAWFPELIELRQAVIDGDYDESPDEDDKADMRKDMPSTMWPMLGLNPSN